MELTLTVPDMANLSQADAQILFAIKPFESETFSLRKAAEVAGLSYRTLYLYELLIRYGVPFVSMTEEEVIEDLANVGQFL